MDQVRKDSKLHWRCQLYERECLAVAWFPAGVRQEQQEKVFREAPFKPVALKMSAADDSEAIPNAYVRQCAVCHGARGEGITRGSLRFPPLIGISSKPRRTVEDLVALLNDPVAYGLEPPMRSFANKLTEDQKQEIAEWIVKLK